MDGAGHPGDAFQGALREALFRGIKGRRPACLKKRQAKSAKAFRLSLRSDFVRRLIEKAGRAKFPVVFERFYLLEMEFS